jgi:hypothetical protein
MIGWGHIHLLNEKKFLLRFLDSLLEGLGFAEGVCGYFPWSIVYDSALKASSGNRKIRLLFDNLSNIHGINKDE